MSPYTRVSTDESGVFGFSSRPPFNRVLQRYWHKQHTRTIIYALASLFTIYFLYHGIGSRPQGLKIYPEVNEEVPLAPPHVWKARAEKVKAAMRHAYHGYERHAFGADELRPLSNRPRDTFNGWGVNIYDSLDTLILLGMNEEYDRALKFVEKADFTMDEYKYAPFFETTIRHLGGLLSAHALRPNAMLVEKASLLADKLDGIFNTTSKFPLFEVDTATGHAKGSPIGILAELASHQLEYTYLAREAEKKLHFDRANDVNVLLAKADLSSSGGMFPVGWNLTSGNPHDTHISAGGQADSAHEYLLKQYLLTGQTEKASLEMYLRFTTHVINHLLYLSPTRHLLYVTDTRAPTHTHRAFPSHSFEHLSCFLPGLFALGAHLLPLDDLSSMGIDLEELGNERLFGAAGKGYSLLAKYDLKQLHMWVATGLAQTCWLTYADQPSGLGPDEVLFQTYYSPDKEANINPVPWMDTLERWRHSGARGIPPGLGDKPPIVFTERERLAGSRAHDYVLKKSQYLLRPETIESLFLLWRITGEARWRERGWKIFEAIEKQTRTESGYASVRSVEVNPAPKEDDMPSYFFAETIKYLYLMFIDDDPIPLDKWVFNTEAHPLPIFKWTHAERERFGIT